MCVCSKLLEHTSFSYFAIIKAPHALCNNFIHHAIALNFAKTFKHAKSYIVVYIIIMG